MPQRQESKDPITRLADDARFMSRGAYPATVKDLTGIADDIERVLASHAKLRAALETIAERTAPPQPHGHYLAHRAAVKVAREALQCPR